MSEPMLTMKQGSKEHRTYLIVTWGLFALFAIALPYILTALFGEFQVGRMNRAIYLAVAILGLNLVIGYSGLIALGSQRLRGHRCVLHRIADHGPRVGLLDDDSGFDGRGVHRRCAPRHPRPADQGLCTSLC